MDEIWAAARQKLAGNLPENKVKTWIEPLRPLRREGNTLFLGCPNQFFLSWVKENYVGSILQALNAAMAEEFGVGPVEGLEFGILPPEPKPSPAEDLLQRQIELPRINARTNAPLRFNPRFTFERFVVGAPNLYAFSAVQAMANEQDLNANSLFLLSEPGLGKSHLAQALGQHVLSRNHQRRVFYLTAEEFTNEMVYSIKNRCTEEFKDKFRRNCDVLVLEEVHFLSGKEKVQAELNYALDSLMESNKRIVMTSSRLPKDIPRLGRQFASRLNNSLISAIEPPDFETRMNILRFKAKEAGLKVPDFALEIMAQRLKNDVRQMESCLNSLGAKSRLLNRTIDRDLVDESLTELVPEGGGVNPEQIRQLICRHYHLTPEELLSRSRRKNIVTPRNLGMFLSRKMTEVSLEAIGKVFGRNHSTVLYAVNLIEHQCRRDQKLKGQVDFLSDQIKRTVSQG